MKELTKKTSKAKNFEAMLTISLKKVNSRTTV